ncbi:MAG: hypothetical protein GY765_16345, partial [bacterium]|nr:hypothetical protein [bacterium]
MKTKKLDKKTILNKVTIANLNDSQLKDLQGGLGKGFADYSGHNSCETCMFVSCGELCN